MTSNRSDLFDIIYFEDVDQLYTAAPLLPAGEKGMYVRNSNLCVGLNGVEINLSAAATPTTAGLLSTGAQSIAGAKTFLGAITTSAVNVGFAYLPAANPYTVPANISLVIANVDNQVENLPHATGSGRTIKFNIIAPSTVLNIYPQSGEQIDALGASAQYQLWAAAFSISLTDVAAGQWASN